MRAAPRTPMRNGLSGSAEVTVSEYTARAPSTNTGVVSRHELQAVLLRGPVAGTDNARARFAEMADELRSENGYRAVYMATNPDAAAQASGLRTMWLAADPAPRGRVSREFITERWGGGALFVAVYDDQHGIYLFEHHPAAGKLQSVLNDGHALGARNLTLTVDYAQKGFTPAQLDEAFRRPEDKRTDAENRALMDWTDALTVGLAQVGFRMRRSELVQLVHAKEAWSLLGKVPARAALPPNAGGVVDSYVEQYTFKAHGLAAREY
jgi:hypothetical protein